MRVAIVTDHFDADRGGAGNWTCQFVRHLLHRDHEVHVFAQVLSPTALQWPIVPHRLPLGVGRLRLASEAEAQLRRLDLDIIHDMGVGWYCDIFHSHDGSRLAQREQNWLATPRFLRPLKRPLYRVLPRYREWDALSARQFEASERLFLALSWMVAHDYQHLHKVPANRIRLVYNGVDTRRFSPENQVVHRENIRRQMGIRKDETLALFVGHDFRRKGLATATRAVARLAQAGAPIRLAVVGGKRPQGGRESAKPPRADGPVTFVGFVYDPVPYYAAADVFVLPSFYDPCSLSVLEAAACGLPSITTYVNGAGELLHHGEDGLLLSNPADDQELASQLRTLLDPALRSHMGNAALAMAHRHTMEHNCDQVLDLYCEVLERHKYKTVRSQARAAA